jgi:hypothetical protein
LTLALLSCTRANVLLAWAGHWRGANATQETVICPLSYERRLPLEQVCSRGYTVANSPLNTFFAVDLLHRVFHVPAISEGIVEHYSEDYAGVLELARTNATFSVRDTDALQYFAIDAWAYDIANPGVGCTGELEDTVSSAAVVVASPTATGASIPPSSTAASADAVSSLFMPFWVRC